MQSEKEDPFEEGPEEEEVHEGEVVDSLPKEPEEEVIEPVKEPAKKTKVEVGHRVQARYRDRTIKGFVTAIIEDGKTGKYVVRCDNGSDAVPSGAELEAILDSGQKQQAD